MSIFTKLRAKAKLNTQNKSNSKLTTSQIGQAVENWVQSQLQQKGLNLIAKNLQTKFGEIDLIMQDQTEIVFIEVRYREQPHFGDGAESVTTKKQRRLIYSAYTFLAMQYEQSDPPCRFDVISVTGKLEKLKMSWIPAAFEVE